MNVATSVWLEQGGIADSCPCSQRKAGTLLVVLFPFHNRHNLPRCIVQKFHILDNCQKHIVQSRQLQQLKSFQLLGSQARCRPSLTAYSPGPDIIRVFTTTRSPLYIGTPLKTWSPKAQYQLQCISFDDPILKLFCTCLAAIIGSNCTVQPRKVFELVSNHADAPPCSSRSYQLQSIKVQHLAKLCLYTSIS